MKHATRLNGTGFQAYPEQPHNGEGFPHANNRCESEKIEKEGK